MLFRSMKELDARIARLDPDFQQIAPNAMASPPRRSEQRATATVNPLPQRPRPTHERPRQSAQTLRSPRAQDTNRRVEAPDQSRQVLDDDQRQRLISHLASREIGDQHSDPRPRDRNERPPRNYQATNTRRDNARNRNLAKTALLLDIPMSSFPQGQVRKEYDIQFARRRLTEFLPGLDPDQIVNTRRRHDMLTFRTEIGRAHV